MKRQDHALEHSLSEVVREVWKEGSPVAQPPFDEPAKTAIRRWKSFARRHDLKKATFEDRVEDLAKGLRDQFERDPRLTGALTEDYRYLAGRLAVVLAERK